jgi:excisionase family DNA binding protein
MSIASPEPGDTERRATRSVGYTVGEVARMLRISTNAAYEMIGRKEIPSVKAGRLLRIPAGAFHDKFGEVIPD